MVILGLGSNVGDRLAHLESAIHLLRESGLDISAISPIYESDALLKEGSPQEWNTKFLNMIIAGETRLAPQDLLKVVKSIEKKIGRQDGGVWSPREIDIDILIYENLEIADDNLHIPHVAMLERDFVLLPLADIEPELLLGSAGVKSSARALANALPENLSIKKTSLQVGLKNG